MFRTLLESGVAPPRRGAEVVLSVILHATLAAAGVTATVRDASPREQPAPQADTVFTYTPEPRGDAHRGGGRTGMVPSAPDLPRLPQLPPLGPEIPPVDPFAGLPGQEVGDELSTVPGNSATAPSNGESTGPFTLDAVDRNVEPLPGNRAPDYPPLLRAAGIEGEVRVRFVVDTSGRVERGTLVVLSAADPRFVQAVQRAVPAMRFTPAEARGRRVRMLVELPFVFRIDGRR